MRHYKDFIDAYVAFTQNQESTDLLRRWVAVSIVAASLGRKVWIDYGHVFLYPNFFIFIIGKSGQIRKSTSTSIGVDFLRHLPNFPIMSDKLTVAAFMDQFKASYRTFRYGDELIQQSPVFCFASELSVFMQEIYGSLKKNLTDFYDCNPKDWRTPFRYTTRTRGKVEIFGPCLNMLACSTPAWLADCLSDKDMAAGFSSRVIFVMENEGTDTPIAWPTKAGDHDEVKGKLQHDLMQIHQVRGPMQIDAAAKDRYTAWYNEHFAAMKLMKDDRFSGYMGRKGDHILKLAMVHSLARSPDLIMQPDDIEWATKMLTDVERSMRDAFGAPGQSGHLKNAELIRKFIENHGEVTLSEIRRTFFQELTFDQYMGAIKLIEDRGVVEKFQKDGKSGFDNLAYRIIPGSKL